LQIDPHIVKKKGISKSKWIADLIREKTGASWPEEIQEIAGQWSDLPANVLPFGQEEAFSAAQIRDDLERKGVAIGPYDVLIAATAVSHRATLITHNRKQFKRVDALKMEDWY
jgi:predicted nucleic acid-binding protein